MDKSPVSRQNSEEIDKFLAGAASFADMMFGFLDESTGNVSDSVDNHDGDGNMDEEDSTPVEENKLFWEAQEQLLQATLYRTTSLESRIRQATKEVMREVEVMGGVECGCRRPVAGGCRDCLRRETSIRLQSKGFNCYICKSKWKGSSEIPSGSHTYLEVLDKSNPKKGEVRVVIELNFRAEFEMATANGDYNKLISRLPELFVGKTERLKALIKILCGAAKKCMKEKKMHLAPWRKHKYMQAKWLAGTYERTTPAALPVGYSDRPVKPKASMLTFDLLDNLPALHCTTAAVELVW